MQISAVIKKELALLSFISLMTVLFILPPQSFAQDSSPAKAPSKTKKTERIFYGMASFYSNKFNGRKTASGEIFSQKKMTCACNVLPLGTMVKVTNLSNKRSVIVKTNDRIHPKVRRVVDLSRVAAEKLGFISSGLTRVKVEVVKHN